MAVPLVLAVASACSSGSTTPASAPASQPSPTVSFAASDALAIAALAHAEQVVLTTASFRFVATEVLSGDTSHATTVRGDVVRAQGVRYTLSANGHTTEVVRIKTATYVRTVPGAWKRLRKAEAVVDPVGSLLTLLRGLGNLTMKAAGTSDVVTGQLSESAAKSAQIPTSVGHPANVALTLDAVGHVTRVLVSTTARGGATAVTLTTAYSGFGAVAPLRAP